MDNDKTNRTPLPAGTILEGSAGTYRIIRVLSSNGGFGLMYLVERTADGKRFALKEFFPIFCHRNTDLLPEAGSDKEKELMEELRDKFSLEATRLKELGIKHPYIIHIHDVFENKGISAFVMEYIPGGDLRSYMEDLDRPLEPAEAVRLMLPLFDAVAALHDNNLLHLDIKPDNVMLRQTSSQEGPRPVLIDFGISKHLEPGGNFTRRSQGSTGCSPGYSAPEQERPTKECPIGEYSDVYSLAATFFFMLTGVNPIPNIDIESQLNEQRPHDIPQSIRKSIKRAMNVLIDRRTPTVDDFAYDLGCKIQRLDNGVVSTVIRPKNDRESRNTILKDNKDDSHNTVLKDDRRDSHNTVLKDDNKESRNTVLKEKTPSAGTSDDPKPAEAAKPVNPATPRKKSGFLKWAVIIVALMFAAMIGYKELSDRSSSPLRKVALDRTSSEKRQRLLEEKQRRREAAGNQNSPTADAAAKNSDASYNDEPEATLPETTIPSGEDESEIFGTAPTEYGIWTGQLLNGEADGEGTVEIDRPCKIGVVECGPGYTLRNALAEAGKIVQCDIYGPEGEYLESVVLKMYPYE